MEETKIATHSDCATVTSQDVTLKQSNVTLSGPGNARTRKIIFCSQLLFDLPFPTTFCERKTMINAAGNDEQPNPEISNSLNRECVRLIGFLRDDASREMKNLVRHVVLDNHTPTGVQKKVLSDCASSSWRRTINQMPVPQIEAAARYVGDNDDGISCCCFWRTSNNNQDILEYDGSIPEELQVFEVVKNNADNDQKTFLLGNVSGSILVEFLFACATTASQKVIDQLSSEQLEYAAWYICGAREVPVVADDEGQMSDLTENRSENLAEISSGRSGKSFVSNASGTAGCSPAGV